jgi:competence protein ComEC
MPPGEYFFFAALFFLGGVGGASLDLNIWILVFNVALMAAFLSLWALKKERRFLALGALSLLITAGAVYCRASVAGLQDLPVPFNAKTSFVGTVDADPRISGGSLDAVLKVSAFGGARILVKLPRYPERYYGDVLDVTGEIKMPEPASYANYLLKERVLGTMSFPQTSLAAAGRGSSVMTWLYGLKRSIVGAFNRTLPNAEAALAAGLTVGERGGFSAAFNQAMRGSGTTHLVALSGYNIMVIVTYATALFLLFCRRRAAVILTVLLIAAFVLMTGAEASVVRAAIMGFILLLAREAGRLFNVRNAIMLAGLVMVMVNPQVLVFDVGFILSFLALIGLVYLEPVLQGVFKYSGQPGLLAWRENLFTTASAQAMVLPVLIQNFGGFSPVSLISNVLVLGLVPLTMGLSFALAGLSFVSSFLASIAGFFVWPLLRFEVGVIEFFGRLPFPALPAFGWMLAGLYYAVIAGFIVWWNRAHNHVQTNRG